MATMCKTDSRRASESLVTISVVLKEILGGWAGGGGVPLRDAGYTNEEANRSALGLLFTAALSVDLAWFR